MNYSSNMDQIGMVAWGLKLGHQAFFSNQVVSPNDEAIERTLEDIRGIVNFSKPNLKFYSLEFTDQYKVYTVFRSIFDWVNRDGAYYAFSLFVPHNTQPAEGEVLLYLNKLSEAYFDGQVDPFRFQIKREPEPVAFYTGLISEWKPAAGRLPADRLNTSTNTKYAAAYYEFEESLNIYFDEPYLEEFKLFKEVYFLPKSSVDANELRYPATVTLLTNLPLSKQRYELKLQFIEKIKGITINLPHSKAPLTGVNETVTNQNGEKLETKGGYYTGLRKGEVLKIIAEKEGYQKGFFDVSVEKEVQESGSRTNSIVCVRELERLSYSVKVKVVDINQHPVSGVKVSIAGRPLGETNHEGLVLGKEKIAHGESIPVEVDPGPKTQGEIERIDSFSGREVKIVVKVKQKVELESTKPPEGKNKNWSNPTPVKPRENKKGAEWDKSENKKQGKTGKVVDKVLNGALFLVLGVLLVGGGFLIWRHVSPAPDPAAGAPMEKRTALVTKLQSDAYQIDSPTVLMYDSAIRTLKEHYENPASKEPYSYYEQYKTDSTVDRLFRENKAKIQALSDKLIAKLDPTPTQPTPTQPTPTQPTPTQPNPTPLTASQIETKLKGLNFGTTNARQRKKKLDEYLQYSRNLKDPANKEKLKTRISTLLTMNNNMDDLEFLVDLEKSQSPTRKEQERLNKIQRELDTNNPASSKTALIRRLRVHAKAMDGSLTQEQQDQLQAFIDKYNQ